MDNDDKLQVYSLDSLMSAEYPPQRWLVDKMIAVDGLTIISAAPASYKTWLALDIALCVAKGEKFLNTFKTEQDSVLIIDEESGAIALQERFKQLGAQKDLPIYWASRVGRKMDKAYLDEILDACFENNIGLVIFDSLIRFHSADENSSSEMSRVLDFFKRICDAGLACLILHHNRKSGPYNSNLAGEAMRGSGDILATCDVQISLSRKANDVTISQSKNRYCEEIKPMTVKFESSDDKSKSSFHFLGFEKSRTEQDELVKEDILQYIDEQPGINKRQLEQGFVEINGSVSYSKISQLLGDLIKEEKIATKRGPKNSQQLFIAGSTAVS